MASANDVAAQIDAEVRDLALEPVDDADDLAPARQRGGQAHLTARLGRRLEQHHRVAACGRNPRRLEPGGAGTDHHDLARRPIRARDHVRQRRLAPGRRVVQTERLAAFVDAIDAVADPDARADARLLAAHDLGDDVRIRHVRPGHADHVDQAFADRVARGREIADARRVEGGHAEGGAHLAGERQVGRRGGAHAGDHVCEAFVGIDVAADHVDEVEHAGGNQAAGDLEPLLAAEPARHVLVHDHADADDVVAAHLRADLVQDLEAEAHAVLQRPAVVVGAPVGRRRPEGIQKMAVGFDLDAVQAALAATPCGGPVRAHDATDVVVLHGLGERAMGGLAHARGGEHRQPVGPVPVGAPAEVGDLAHHRGAVRVHGPRERLEIGDDALVEQMQVAERRRRVGSDDGRAADHGERDAALGLLLVVQAVARPGRPSSE